MGNLFKGRMRVPYYYSCFGYTRGNGKTWHGGQDVVGLDSDTILLLILVYFLLADTDENGEKSNLADTLLIVGALLLLGF